ARIAPRRLPFHQLHDLVADAEEWVERAVRILRHEGDPAALDVALERRAVHGEDVHPVETDGPAVIPRVRGQNAEHGARERRLPAAGLADETHDGSTPDAQIDAVKNAHDPRLSAEA